MLCFNICTNGHKDNMTLSAYEKNKPAIYKYKWRELNEEKYNDISN